MRRKSLLVLTITLLALLVTALLPAPLHAQGVTPSLLNYQGLLADTDGLPITAQGLVVTFRIWDDPTSTDPTALRWEETLTIDVNNGLFNVILGELVPITEDVFETSESYLGLTIQGEPESTPRTRLVSVGYSTRVETVDGARGGVISGTIGIEDGDVKTEGQVEPLRYELFGSDGIIKFWASETEVLTPCVLFSGDSTLQCTAAINSGAAQAEEGVNEVTINSDVTPILSQSINCPTDGYVIVLGSYEAEVNIHSHQHASLVTGVSDQVDAFPPDQNKRWTLRNAEDKSFLYYRDVISLSKIFAVSPGENTFHILGQKTEGPDFTASQMTLSLLFIPAAYGSVSGPEALVGNGGAASPAASVSRNAVGGQQSATTLELQRQAAEIAELKEQIEELRVLLKSTDLSSR